MTSTTTPIPEGKYLDMANGYRVHYHEAGPADGQPVIFLHGSGSGASGYSNFKGNYPEFAKAGFRCFVPDILGYGLSSKPDLEMYDTDFFTSGIKALVDGLGLKNIILLGNSLGGALCLDYALKYPAEVAKLILMAPGGLATLDEYKQMPGIQALFSAHKTASSPREALRTVMNLQVVDKSLITEDIINERAPIAAMQTTAARSALKVPNYTEQLPKIQQPILGFWGMQDCFTPPSGAQKVLDGCPNARFVLLNRCGHWVQVEHREMFNRTCIDFMQNG